MNVSDSERIKGVLANEGYKISNDENDADIILLNTCSVRQSAEQKVWSNLGRLNSQKGGKVLLGVVGCMAQQYGSKVFTKAPYVSLVCGTYRFHKIGKLLEDCRKNSRVVDVGCREDDIDGYSGAIRDSRISAWVPISRGCNNKCSYCVVPSVRGTERNRPISEIIDEITKLASSGYKEVTLLGQNVNSYVNPQSNEGFVELLKEVDKINGIGRIRFITSHPKDASPDLFKAIGELDKVCEHLHLPAQSGSNRILEKMNRGYTREHYIGLLGQIRKIVPDIAISTDIIVGFPGETEEDFQDTYNLMKEAEFDSAFIFKYSIRSGTSAADLPDSVSPDAKLERNHCLLKLQKEISFSKNKQLIGKMQEVLVEGVSKNNKNRLMGRTRTNKIMVFTPLDAMHLTGFEGETDLIGQLVNVKIVDATPFTLIGG